VVRAALDHATSPVLVTPELGVAESPHEPSVILHHRLGTMAPTL